MFFYNFIKKSDLICVTLYGLNFSLLTTLLFCKVMMGIRKKKVEKITNLFKEKKYKVGYALSGGGIRGLCHAGVLKALEEEGIKPSVISGVSAGAIVGALYCDGYSPEEIVKIFEGVSFRSMADLQRPKSGLFSAEKFEKFLGEKLRAKTFEELKIPLKVVCTNFETGEIKVFDKGDLLETLIASSSLPVMFVPKVIDSEYFVDGGVVKNFPVSVIRDDCEYVIGVNLNPTKNNKMKESISSVVWRTYQFMLRANIILDRDLCDILIEPENIRNYDIFESDKAQEIYDMGYKTAKEMLTFD